MKNGFLCLALLLGGCRAAVQPPPARTAQLCIVVPDTSQALGAIAQSVEAAGGVVVASDAWREKGRLRATMTLRVAPEQLTTTLRVIREMALRVDDEHLRRNVQPAPTGGRRGHLHESSGPDARSVPCRPLPPA